MKLLRGLVWRLFKIDLANMDDRNAWLLVAEMFWASILGSFATFNAAYAIRLGADNIQVSLLSSIPALMAVLVSIPAGQFLQRRPRRTPWVFGSLLVYRSGFLLVALAPWLNMFGIEPGLTAVLILVAISAPAHFFNVGWIPMLAEIVPEHRRAAVFAARNIINQASLSVMVFLAGMWLDTAAFPMNYQVMYLVGFFFSMLGMYCLVRLRVEDSPVDAAVGTDSGVTVADSVPVMEMGTDLPAVKKPAGWRPGPRGWLRSARRSAARLRTELREQPAFVRIMVNTFLHGLGVWMVAPLYVLYYVRQLGASDAWLGLNGTLAGFSLWRWLMARWGEPVSLKRTIVLVGLYPVLVGLTPSLPVILIFGVLNGLVVPGVNLSHFNMLLKVIPGEARPRYTAIYMTMMNAGAFVSPMIAIFFAERIGLAPMLVIAGLLSVIGSTSFWWNPVLPPEQPIPVPLEVEAGA
jgi:hypothetical protein